jgi:membrane fusion protein (multidrug efflux system)
LTAIWVFTLAPPVAAEDTPLPAVTVAPVVKKNIAPTHDFVGRVVAIQLVQLHALVQGILQQVAFKEGSDVKEGQLLFLIDPILYQAQVDNAKAGLAKAQATLQNDQKTVERDQALIKTYATPQSTLDQASATRDADAAGVSSAQAELRIAETNLGYTRITAPISGRIGAATVTRGNLVGTTTGPLATIVQLDPIRVVFSVDDQSLVAAEQKSGSSVEELTKQFLPHIRFNNGTTYDKEGKLTFISNQVDQTTGTIPIYAEFSNPNGLLLPGQFVTIVVAPTKPDDRLVVPVAAVQQDKQGKFVLLVGADNRVRQQRIEATRQIGEDWVVDQGLQADQKVIVEGLQKVKSGQAVNPQLAANPQQGPPGSSQ